MPDQFTAGMLGAHIAAANLPWRIDPNLADHALIAKHPLGADPASLRLATSVPLSI
ncbi:hypothetical protein [Paraburkholderia xenovorans]|uniref:hypothetical protein n=1 Tax=Paraburkholderia xenovorans TaxID=36873 RepID=UPI0038BBF330